MRLCHRAIVAVLFLSLIFVESVNASSFAESLSDLRMLQSQGFVTSKTTKIVGQFTGCETGQVYHLLNGNDFECDPVQVVQNPEVITLKNPKTGEVRFIIQDTEYDGEMENNQD